MGPSCANRARRVTAISRGGVKFDRCLASVSTGVVGKCQLSTHTVPCKYLGAGPSAFGSGNVAGREQLHFTESEIVPGMRICIS